MNAKPKDKTLCVWKVVVKGVRAIPFYGNDVKLVNMIVMASKVMKEPEIAREILL